MMTYDEALRHLSVTPDDGGYRDIEECWHETLVDYVAYRLDFCGCGDPPSAVKLAAHFMERMEKKQRLFPEDAEYPNEVIYFVLYALDSRELAEHGGSVGGAWLTRAGEACLALLHHEEPGWFNGR
jgi:hypothetical protein